jgi:hypothetical protein
MKRLLFAILTMGGFGSLLAQPPSPQYAPPLPQIHADAIAWADFNLDGRPDLFLAGLDSAGQRSSVLLRNDSIVFTPIATGFPDLNEAAAAWGDYDGDGDPDLMLCGKSATGAITELWRNDGTAGFSQVPIFAPALRHGTVNWGDMDNDNDLDVFLTGYNYGRVYLATFLRNDGGGQFTEMNDPELIGVAHATADLSDIDGDSLPDIAVSGYDIEGGTTLRLYKNLGGFDFTPISNAIPEVVQGNVEWADYDNDSDPDLLVCGSAPRRSLSIWQNNGGSFSEVITTLPSVSPGAARWGDFDLDNRPDILVCGFGNQGAEATILKQTTVGGFADNQPSQPLYPVQNPRISWQDWNGDGYPDFAISGQDAQWQPITLLYRYFPLSGEFKY